MTGVHVFVGPTLGIADARAVLPDATYHAPVQMGDVHAALADHPRILCILDGMFERVPAVWHKEILFALSRGVRVVGAASMGALRAAELHDHGMEGVGAVFEAFRAGVLTADDEVALIHAPAEHGYRPLSEALVNLRDGLSLAVERGVVTVAERDALVAEARRTFYPDRSWSRVFEHARALGMAADRIAALRTLVDRERPDVKRRDAIAALHHIAATLDQAPPAAPEFEPTEFWHQLVATTARRAGAGDAPRADRILAHARVVLGDGSELRRSALLALLASLEADRSGLGVGSDELAAAAERLRRRLGLTSAERTRRFLSDQGLSERDLAEACRLEVIYDHLIRRSGRALEAATVAELQRSGRYAALAGSAERVQQILAARGFSDPSLADAGLDEAALLAWYAARFRPIRGGLDAHARELGFRDTPAFLREVLRQYCAGIGAAPAISAG